MFTGILGSLEGVAVVLGPIIGGAIASHIGWRWCFWVNLPIGGVLFIVLVFLFKPPQTPGQQAPLKDRIKGVDFIGGTGLVGSITCLLLALEWGSTLYNWSDARLIGLLVVFGVSFISVAVHQHWLKEKATFPTRLLRNRSFASSLWYGFALSSAQMVVLYYVSHVPAAASVFLALARSNVVAADSSVVPGHPGRFCPRVGCPTAADGSRPNLLRRVCGDWGVHCWIPSAIHDRWNNICFHWSRHALHLPARYREC